MNGQAEPKLEWPFWAWLMGMESVVMWGVFFLAIANLWTAASLVAGFGVVFASMLTLSFYRRAVDNARDID